ALSSSLPPTFSRGQDDSLFHTRPHAARLPWVGVMPPANLLLAFKFPRFLVYVPSRPQSPPGRAIANPIKLSLGGKTSLAIAPQRLVDDFRVLGTVVPPQHHRRTERPPGFGQVRSS
ncbi:unnamed protein product, partial [Ectocarpus sp. 12 AP-2014]